jgi:hypothetical protein
MLNKGEAIPPKPFMNAAAWAPVSIDIHIDIDENPVLSAYP